jgi:hypothetical protein
MCRNSLEMTLPDKNLSGLSLTQGKLMGLTNMERSGEALLEERQERVYLTFSFIVKDLTGCYSWMKRNFRYFAFE